MNELSITSFLDKLATKEPVPGGGGTSALAGAIGVALGNMVGSLTVGKKKYAAVEADIIALNEKAEAIRQPAYHDGWPCSHRNAGAGRWGRGGRKPHRPRRAALPSPSAPGCSESRKWHAYKVRPGWSGA